MDTLTIDITRSSSSDLFYNYDGEIGLAHELTTRSIYDHLYPHPTNCPNCGAPLKSGECEYCGSEVY